MKMKNNTVLADQSPREVLDEPLALPTSEIELSVDEGSNDKSRSTGVVDPEALDLLTVELDNLANHWSRQSEICHWILELLEEIEQPTGTIDVEQIKGLIYQRISWLRWDKKELATASNEDEMKLLRTLTAKSIGAKARVKKTNEPTVS